MDSSRRREILTRVASGQLTPEDAAEQLGEAEEAAEKAPATGRVRVTRQLGSTEIVGDATVREAVADGPHRARVEGDTLIIEGEYADAGGFTFGGRLPWGIGSEVDHRLVVRMNPALALELDVQAGSCRVRDVDGPIRADVQAGSLKIEGLRSALQASVQAGSLKVSGVVREGASRISCEAGSVNVRLEQGSSVQVAVRSSLGKVTLPGVSGAVGRGASEATIGAGQATLQIESTMGSVLVSAE